MYCVHTTYKEIEIKGNGNNYTEMSLKVFFSVEDLKKIHQQLSEHRNLRDSYLMMMAQINDVVCVGGRRVTI